MIAAGSMVGDRRHASRITLLTAIGAAHLLAIWLLLQSGAMPMPTSIQQRLALFDVIPPAPPEQRLPPLPRPPRIVGHAGGGSPGIRRERAAAMVETPAPPARDAIEVTPTPGPSRPPPASMAGSAPVDLGRGGADGVGTGSGSGVGRGDGHGRGTGSGEDEEDVFARAEWLERPPTDTWRRAWPRGRERLAQQVRVKVTCKVRTSGRPYACRVRSESPARLGFGATALAVLRESRVKPVARNGENLWDLPVLISIVFEAIETAPRIPSTAAASVPLAR